MCLISFAGQALEGELSVPDVAQMLMLSSISLIAIMLGRLKMDVSACLEAYLEISDKVFVKKAHRLDWKGEVQARFSSDKLKAAIIKVIKDEGYEPDMALVEKQEPKCKV